MSELALITVALILPALFAASVWFKRASERGYDRVRDGIANVLADLSESLHGVRIVTAHNRQRHNVIHHRNVVGDYRDANNYTARVNAIYGPGTQLLGVLGQAVLLAVGGSMVVDHTLSLGGLVAFFLYLNRFFQPIQLAGPAVQHLPAGPGFGEQAADPGGHRTRGPRGTRRGRAAPDRGRDRLRPRVLRLRTRPAGHRGRRPAGRTRARRWPSSARPGPASRPWPSW